MKVDKAQIFWLVIAIVTWMLFGCSGGGGDAPPLITETPVDQPTGPPPPARLIYRTENAFVAAQTDGRGTACEGTDPGLDTSTLFITGSTAVFQIARPPVPELFPGFGLLDIHQIQTDCSQPESQPVANTPDDEIIRDVFGPWVLYEQVVYAQGAFVSSTIRSARLDGLGRFLVTDAPETYQVHVGERAVFAGFGLDRNLFSVLMDGTDRRPLTTGSDAFLSSQFTAGSQVIFNTNPFPASPNLFAVPVAGGPVSTLAEGPEYKWVGGVVGNRVVYHRCAIVGTNEDGFPVAGPCDVASVLSNGTGTVALASQPVNEVVMGVVGSRVIINRNVDDRTDQIYSIAADGRGGETPIITLDARTEFVAGFAGDRILLQRQSSRWSIRSDGSELVQLADNVDRFADSASVGAFACFSRGPALWCVPADGSAAPTKVADVGQFVTGLTP